MKNIKAYLIALCIISVASCSVSSPAKKQNKKDKAAEIATLIEDKEFVYKAQMILPMGGRSRQLNPEYDLVVSADSINCALPYMGRSFTAPIDPTNIGVDFISTDFDYAVTQPKDGLFHIVITPHDNQMVRHLTLNISTNGYASLNAVFFNRQPVQYNGYVISREANQ